MTVTGSIGSGFTMTQGTRQAVTTADYQNSANDHSVIYDAESGKFVFSYKDGSSVKVRSGTVSSNTLSLGTEVTVASSNVSGAGGLIADGNAGSGLITSGGYNNTSYSYQTISVAANGNITVGSATALSGHYARFSGAYRFNIVPITANSAQSSYWVFGTGNNGNDTSRDGFKIAITSDSSEFIGFTAGAISSGASGDVTVIGGVNDQQSGLTAGQKYYIQAGGNITTDSGGTYAGRALSATKLLVKG